MVKNISPKDLKSRLDAGEDIVLIDIREDWEVEIGKLPNADHIPMNDIPDSLDRIPKDKPVVFICHHGNRSSAATNWIEAQGYKNVLNLTGGVDGWMQEVDPSFPGRY